MSDQDRLFVLAEIHTVDPIIGGLFPICIIELVKDADKICVALMGNLCKCALLCISLCMCVYVSLSLPGS